jgi:glucokinase
MNQSHPSSPPANWLGIEIGGTKLQIVLGTEAGLIKERWRLAVRPDHGARGIQTQIKSCLGEILQHHSIKGIGVGFGGPVDWRTGRICRSHQIEGWSEFELGSWLTSLARAPVRVDNDANVAALGEALAGAGQNANPVFYVTLGSGVGGGLVVDRRIYHGALPGESELGHLRLDPQGTTLESQCSGWAVDAKIRSLEKTAPESVLSQLAAQNPGNEAKQLRSALQRNDFAALELLAETASHLAFGLSHVIHLFHPEQIIVGGGLSLLGAPLQEAVEDQLPRFVMEAFHPPPRITLSALREDAVPIGALQLARGISVR